MLRCKAAKLADCCAPPLGPTKWEDLGNPAIGPEKTPEGATFGVEYSVRSLSEATSASVFLAVSS